MEEFKMSEADKIRNNSNGNAFPLSHGDSFATGLTKREYFAGLALQGLLADPNVTNFKLVVRDAVSLADDLLIELSKQP